MIYILNTYLTINIHYTITKHTMSAYQKRKKKLVSIYNNTKRMCKNIELDNNDCEAFDITDTGFDVNAEYDTFETQVYVEDTDTLLMIKEFVELGYNPLALNMASAQCPGGGVWKGCMAQEEELFRRTTACMTHKKDLYPLPKHTVLYSQSVKIIKDEHYNVIDDYVDFSMITVPAVCKPTIDNETYADTNDYDLMDLKIKSIFEIGIMKGHDVLVLGALGCGAYSNPKNAVLQLFAKHTKTYSEYFEHIGFAVKVCKKSDQENFDIFYNEFC